MKANLPPRPAFPVITSADVRAPLQRLYNVVEKLSVEAPDGSQRLPVPDLKLAAANSRDAYVKSGLTAIRNAYLGVDEEGDIFSYDQVMESIVKAEEKVSELVTRGGTDTLSPKDGKDACALGDDPSLSGKLAARTVVPALSDFKRAKRERATAVSAARTDREHVINKRKDADKILATILTKHAKSYQAVDALKWHFLSKHIDQGDGITRLSELRHPNSRGLHWPYDYACSLEREIRNALVKAEPKARTRRSLERSARYGFGRADRTSHDTSGAHLGDKAVRNFLGFPDLRSAATKAQEEVHSKLGMSYEDYLAGKDLPEIRD